MGSQYNYTISSEFEEAVKNELEIVEKELKAVAPTINSIIDKFYNDEKIKSGAGKNELDIEGEQVKDINELVILYELDNITDSGKLRECAKINMKRIYNSSIELSSNTDVEMKIDAKINEILNNLEETTPTKYKEIIRKMIIRYDKDRVWVYYGETIANDLDSISPMVSHNKEQVGGNADAELAAIEAEIAALRADPSAEELTRRDSLAVLKEEEERRKEREKQKEEISRRNQQHRSRLAELQQADTGDEAVVSTEAEAQAREALETAEAFAPAVDDENENIMEGREEFIGSEDIEPMKKDDAPTLMGVFFRLMKWVVSCACWIFIKLFGKALRGVSRAIWSGVLIEFVKEMTAGGPKSGLAFLYSSLKTVVRRTLPWCGKCETVLLASSGAQNAAMGLNVGVAGVAGTVRAAKSFTGCASVGAALTWFGPVGLTALGVACASMSVAGTYYQVKDAINGEALLNADHLYDLGVAGRDEYTTMPEASIIEKTLSESFLAGFSDFLKYPVNESEEYARSMGWNPNSGLMPRLVAEGLDAEEICQEYDQRTMIVVYSVLLILLIWLYKFLQLCQSTTKDNSAREVRSGSRAAPEKPLRSGSRERRKKKKKKKERKSILNSSKSDLNSVKEEVIDKINDYFKIIHRLLVKFIFSPYNMLKESLSLFVSNPIFNYFHSILDVAKVGTNKALSFVKSVVENPYINPFIGLTNSAASAIGEFRKIYSGSKKLKRKKTKRKKKNIKKDKTIKRTNKRKKTIKRKKKNIKKDKTKKEKNKQNKTKKEKINKIKLKKKK